jgi:TatA/E family protein of Tat protein translocase
MGPIGWPELIILLVVVLIIFGPGKLPDIGNAIGRGVKEFRKASNDLESSIRGEATKPTPPATPATPATPPAADDQAEAK